ncbi:virB8 family protein [Aurantiacibacter luteus]|uniref:virB8 family protein n=1 Tax=Aurantiacibacter luteus TaxID=1581420 RepID=UPI0007ACD89D|nr:VirB8/TrbF family protein [Aurantiacibacter luteus]
MTAQGSLDDDFDFADTWATSVTDELERSRRIAWIVATVAAAIALLLAIAIVVMLPLKTTEPYTILVDRQTGNVETLAPFDEDLVAADAALTRSFLVQYVIAREGYDYPDLQEDFRKVSLWSAGEARQRYDQLMRAGQATSPVVLYGRDTRVTAEVRSVSSLDQNRALVRFSTVRSDRGGQPGVAQHWAAVIDFEFSAAGMSEQDRYLNPLGFQVTRYRRDAETLPEALPSEIPAELQVDAPA